MCLSVCAFLARVVCHVMWRASSSEQRSSAERTAPLSLLDTCSACLRHSRVTVRGGAGVIDRKRHVGRLLAGVGGYCRLLPPAENTRWLSEDALREVVFVGEVFLFLQRGPLAVVTHKLWYNPLKFYYSQKHPLVKVVFRLLQNSSIFTMRCYPTIKCINYAV